MNGTFTTVRLYCPTSECENQEGFLSPAEINAEGGYLEGIYVLDEVCPDCGALGTDSV